MTSDVETDVLVVGGSVGGVRTVQQLRRLGFGGRVTLVEAEERPPYDRPPLSKESLLSSAAAVPTLLSVDQANAIDVQLLCGRAAKQLVPDQRLVLLEDGQRVRYTRAVVVATGARARTAPWPQSSRLITLRTWDDAERLRRHFESARRLVVIGAGFIGAEVASAATARGLAVDLIDLEQLPMARHVGAELATEFVALHRRHGVVPHFGTSVRSVQSGEDFVRVELSDGTTLDADAAVVGLGTQLNLEWLESSGLRLDDGLVCDQHCRASGSGDVFGVGDVARWWHRGHGKLMRSEHWTNAVEQAAAVAQNIVHPDVLTTHEPISYVWSNQYDWKIQLAGCPAEGVESVRIQAKEDRFVVLFGDTSGRLCGAVSVNWPPSSIQARKALAQGQDLGGVATSLRARVGAAPARPDEVVYK